jgi:hypothetical protein
MTFIFKVTFSIFKKSILSPLFYLFHFQHLLSFVIILKQKKSFHFLNLVKIKQEIIKPPVSPFVFEVLLLNCVSSDKNE